MNARNIYEKVQERYGLAAKDDNADYGHEIAKAFGYTIAQLSQGETVVDLGSGARFDVFLAAKKVGSSGKAIGVDMNKDMLERANRNKEKAKADNVEFIESAITDIAIPKGTANCIISNCVMNLVPEQEKQLAFNEMFRLLKPGGRVAISDILLKKELPQELKENMALYVGCIAGASLAESYERYLHEAGFNDVLIVDSKGDLNVYRKAKEYNESNCDGPPHRDAGELARPNATNIDFNGWAGSFKIYAVKS